MDGCHLDNKEKPQTESPEPITSSAQNKLSEMSEEDFWGTVGEAHRKVNKILSGQSANFQGRTVK